MKQHLHNPIDGNGEIFKSPTKLSSLQKNARLEVDDFTFADIYTNIEYSENIWVEKACDLAIESVKHGGGPFGAIVLQLDSNTNEIIRYWQAVNLVAHLNDPTAHAEIMAIRRAAHSLGVYHLNQIDKATNKLPQPGPLSRCLLISSCEPCPMCLAAIYWAKIDEVYFAATRFTAGQPQINFSDAFIYNELDKPYYGRQLKIGKCVASNVNAAFKLWQNSNNKPY
ncbi:MAG: nucleoside deaminase [Deltaproteobacteria bacterium]|nr:nucleoside deaminase [Deltaproteobacteria bacterium]